MQDKRKSNLKRVTYYDDLTEADQKIIQRMLSSNLIGQLVKFKNANGNNLTCLPYTVANTEYLVVLDKRNKSRKTFRSSYRFDPLSDSFDLMDYDLG